MRWTKRHGTDERRSRRAEATGDSTQHARFAVAVAADETGGICCRTSPRWREPACRCREGRGEAMPGKRERRPGREKEAAMKVGKAGLVRCHYKVNCLTNVCGNFSPDFCGISRLVGHCADPARDLRFSPSRAPLWSKTRFGLGQTFRLFYDEKASLRWACTKRSLSRSAAPTA